MIGPGPGDPSGRAQRVPVGDQPRTSSDRTFKGFFDESAFLSPYGLRALSKRYENNPYTLPGIEGRVDRLPARRGGPRACSAATRTGAARSGCRSTTWPLRRSFVYQRYFGDDFKPQVYPTGSGQERTFSEIAQDIADRLLYDLAPGRGRPPPGLRRHREAVEATQLWKDSMTFNEYFHGDNGAGLGATHQTGWTAIVADLILDPARVEPEAGLGRVDARDRRGRHRCRGGVLHHHRGRQGRDRQRGEQRLDPRDVIRIADPEEPRPDRAPWSKPFVLAPRIGSSKSGSAPHALVAVKDHPVEVGGVADETACKSGLSERAREDSNL